MKYLHLIEVLKTFEKKISCPNCKSDYDPNHMEAIGIIGNNLFFLTKCIKCKKDSVIQVCVEEGKLLPINDIDVKNLKKDLKNFKGSIKSLFK